MIDDGADLLTARRIHTDAAAYRPGHVMGNRMLTGLTALLFNVHLSDMLSGYRVFSRRFVKSFPFTAEGFAIETELTVHAVRLMMPMSGDGYPLQGTAGGLGQQAQHLARRLPHPGHHRLSGAGGAAADFLFGHCRPVRGRGRS